MEPPIERSRWTSRLPLPALLVLALALALVMLVAPGAALTLVETKPIDRCDLMVILGGGALERLSSGVELHIDGACDRVLLTGRPSGEEIPRGRTILREMDPLNRIEPSTMTRSTLGDAWMVYEVARREGFKHLLIVTSPYHTRRVIWIFSRVLSGTGIEFGVLPSQAFYMDYARWWTGSYGRGVVVSEYVKLWLLGLAVQGLQIGATLPALGPTLP